jgi:diguanylate cyclase (GGDEF)-like protein
MGRVLAFIVAILLLAGARMVALHKRVRVLEAQAITDPLTGAFNRRHMDATLTTAVERHRRTGERASLLMVDVDGFKEINDLVGHAGGDRALQALVALIAQRMRAIDGLFRVGGEEFALLLSGTRFSDAMSVAEGLRALVEAAGLVPGGRLSISVGVSELAHGQAIAQWIDEADSALYRAKRGGRNRVAGKRLDSAVHTVETVVRVPVRIP